MGNRIDTINALRKAVTQYECNHGTLTVSISSQDAVNCDGGCYSSCTGCYSTCTGGCQYTCNNTCKSTNHNW